MKRRIFRSSHTIPLLILFALCSLYWIRVLVSDQVLLPGEFLRGFAPFGNDARAPWNILQWDALGQYFPWRTFAARQLQAGQIPLWNPYQFAGTPFLANGQSAVFYPLSAPFWFFDVARAFGISAWLHSLLACFGSYFLSQHWKLSRQSSLLAAVAFGFCGYLTFWVTLPTLSNTASWLPLLILLFERALPFEGELSDKSEPSSKRATEQNTTIQNATKQNASDNRVLDARSDEARWARARDFWLLALALSCAFLAGHPQIFIYCVFALFLRALTWPLRRWKRAFSVLLPALGATLVLCAIQILPTLELARLGHRAGQSASAEGWNFVAANALQFSDLPSFFNPFQPMLSFGENKGYIGLVVLLLASMGIVAALLHRSRNEESSTRSAPHNAVFAVVLAVFGLAFALASPLSQLFYFGVPGLSQMGGVGRALSLWSLGAAFLAAFGLDFLRARWKSPLLPLIALLFVTGELFAATWNTQPTAPRASIYPDTTLTKFLQAQTKNGGRVLLWTPRKGWFATEDLPPGANVSHPTGILPPNGATVYGINDINGYDSLSSGAFRQFLNGNEGADVSPPRNGNMVFVNNLQSPALDALDVRFVVVPETARETIVVPNAREVLRSDGCVVFQRNRVLDSTRQTSGRDFFPGWTGDKYNPTSFRLGAWLSLLGLGVMSFHLSTFGARIASSRVRLRTQD